MAKPKLLLADDSVTIRKVVELTFADEGIDVHTAVDGETAMQKFVEVQPDIVLVDTGLPGTSGYHICEMIKQDEATAHLPVLLLVGSFEPFDQDEAERVAADGFLTKPFHSIRDLVARVWDLLGHDGSAVDAVEVAAPALAAEEVGETVPASDIDDLYRSSIGPTAEPADFEPVDDIFDDSEIDDELIEANRLGSNGSGDLQSAALEQEQAEKTDEFDWLPDSMADEAEAVETADKAFMETIESSEPAVAAAVEEPEPEPKSFDWSAESIVDQPLPVEAVDAAITQPIETAEPAVEETAEQRDVVTKEFDWSAGSLVTEASQSAEAGPFPEVSAVDQSQPDQPSPEFINLVAQRVVEKLSDQVIRDIAKDAVPRIAEKLIREALEEDKKS